MNFFTGKSSVAEPVTTDKVTSRTQKDTPSCVVIHDSDRNSFTQVEQGVMCVLHFSAEKAKATSKEVHTKGRSVVWQGHKERAELYCQLLREFTLNVTMEK